MVSSGDQGLSLHSSSEWRKRAAESLQGESYWGLIRAVGTECTLGSISCHQLPGRTQAARTLPSPPCSPLQAATLGQNVTSLSDIFQLGAAGAELNLPWNESTKQQKKFWLSLWVTTQKLHCLPKPIQTSGVWVNRDFQSFRKNLCYFLFFCLIWKHCKCRMY